MSIIAKRLLHLPIVFFALQVATIGFAEISIPSFTPNTVDISETLSTDDIQLINNKISEITKNADVKSAVFIVKDLEGGSIETVAERAFRKWKLGDKGKDNGILLTLSMNDRKSRVEVGYGLEGKLTDALCKRILDGVLRPYMKAGRVREGIIATLGAIQSVAIADGQFETEIDLIANQASNQNPHSNTSEDASEDEFFPAVAIKTYIVYLLALWLTFPLSNFLKLSMGKSLQKKHSSFRVASDPNIRHLLSDSKSIFFGKTPGYTLGIIGFMTLNPGAFVLLGAGFMPFLSLGIMLLTILISIGFVLMSIKKYVSVATYEKFVASERRKFASLVSKGYAKEYIAGHFEFTSDYYNSPEYKESQAKSDSSSSSSDSSSSSSDSDSSSSSGGGSSGGGGASSGW